MMHIITAIITKQKKRTKLSSNPRSTSKNFIIMIMEIINTSVRVYSI